MVHYQI